MRLSLVTACLTSAAVLAWWVPPPLSRLAATTELLPGWISRLGPWIRRQWPKRRKQRELANQLPEALELLACCLAAGAPMSRAIQLVAEVSPPATQRLLAGVSAALTVGRDPTAAWLSLADHPDWGPPARDAARSARSGTSLAAGLQIQAEEARRRLKEEQHKRARAIGVKSVQPLVLCFLPAFVCLGVVPLLASLVSALLG